MPTYQYACKESACGHRFEAVQSFSDDPLTACPVCEGQVRKVFSAVGVVFKGSGFYRNDSREPAKASSGKNGAAAKDSDSGSGSGSDSGSGSGSGSGEKKAESASSTSSNAGSGSSGAGSSNSSSGSTSTAAAS